MTTLGQELLARGYGYHSVLSNRAEDIYFDNAEELCLNLGFIVKHITRFDFEIPQNYNSGIGYPITNGMTSGGNPMKYGREYRIYFDTTDNMPQKIASRLQNDNKKRITGSLFVEACYYLGFRTGSQQNFPLIINNINTTFNSSSERSRFAYGQTL